MMNIVGVLIMFLITLFKQEGNLRQKVLEERRKYREDKEKQEAASRTIVMTSFASTERIYLSNRDLINPYASHHYLSTNTIMGGGGGGSMLGIHPNHLNRQQQQPPQQQQVSRIIEFTSFASSERIYFCLLYTSPSPRDS